MSSNSPKGNTRGIIPPKLFRVGKHQVALTHFFALVVVVGASVQAVMSCTQKGDEDPHQVFASEPTSAKKIDKLAHCVADKWNSPIPPVNDEESRTVTRICAECAYANGIDSGPESPCRVLLDNVNIYIDNLLKNK